MSDASYSIKNNMFDVFVLTDFIFWSQIEGRV